MHLILLSILVLRDLTCVLLDQKFVEQLMNPHPNQNILTTQQCRILLTDIACCSLMRLDITSMDKLWDLMVMVFKWQLFHIQDQPHKLMDITFRHMDGIGKLMPEMKKSILIDCTKRSLIELWDKFDENEKSLLLDSLTEWFQLFSVKISILIRLGFQRGDASFELEFDHKQYEHFADYIENIGENIYAKNHEAMLAMKAAKQSGDAAQQKAKCAGQKKSNEINQELASLATQLKISHEGTTNDLGNESKAPNSVLLLDDFLLTFTGTASGGERASRTEKESTQVKFSEFVHCGTTQSTLQKYLEQFRLETSESTSDPEGKNTAKFDATEELLKMLDQD